MKLRDYQEAAVEAVLKSWQKNRSCLIVLPTGCGKTVVFGEVIRRRLVETCSHAMILAHREELIAQAAEKVGDITGTTVDIEMGPREIPEAGPGSRASKAHNGSASSSAAPTGSSCRRSASRTSANGTGPARSTPSRSRPCARQTTGTVRRAMNECSNVRMFEGFEEFEGFEGFEEFEGGGSSPSCPISGEAALIAQFHEPPKPPKPSHTT